VFATAVIGLDAISPPHVHRYIKRVKGYATRYGPLCWAVVYQTEVRFRREFAERIRREEATKFKVATDAGGAYSAYDPARPWDRVYELAGKDMTEFWHEHLEEPCQCICSKARSANAFIDGDAEVARNSRDHLATATGSTVTYAGEELSEWDLVGAEPGATEPQPSAQAADSSRESASACGSVLCRPLVGASKMVPREVGLEHQPCSAGSTILLGSGETREHHQTPLPGAAPVADLEAALAFAQLFPIQLRQQSLAATGRGDSLRAVVQSLLRQLEGEPTSSPGSSSAELAAPTTELREGSRGPPREDGLCVCGRTLSHGGGRVHARCCSHCCEGTHSSSCQKRERRRQAGQQILTSHGAGHGAN